MGILCMMLPSSPASEGISLMLNSEDPQERDELTRTWRDHKLEELNFVGTLVSQLHRYTLSPSHTTCGNTRVPYSPHASAPRARGPTSSATAAKSHGPSAPSGSAVLSLPSSLSLLPLRRAYGCIGCQPTATGCARFAPASADATAPRPTATSPTGSRCTPGMRARPSSS
jgi:hypothetical protein